MTELSALDTARALAAPVNLLGGRWMLVPETLGESAEAGYPNGFVYYAAGRGGVLGDVDADVVAAAFGYFNPALVRTMWEQGLAVEPPRQAADRYAAACARYGRIRLADVTGMERLADLAEAVVRGVDPCGLPLFAGWRAQPLPDDAAGRAYQLVHVMRELRGSVHIIATTSVGLSPRECILAQEGAGPERAAMFGWGEPHPELGEDRLHLRQQAEDLTDVIMARHIELALTPAERSELVELVATLQSAMDAAG